MRAVDRGIVLALGGGGARGLAHIGVLEFHHGKTAVAAGREAAIQSLPAIRRLIGA